MVEGVGNVETNRSSALAQPAGLPEREGSEPRGSRPVEQPVKAVIQFATDQVSGDLLMRLVDTTSGEVVRQIPPEELIDLSRVLGLLFDRVA